MFIHVRPKLHVRSMELGQFNCSGWNWEFKIDIRDNGIDDVSWNHPPLKLKIRNEIMIIHQFHLERHFYWIRNIISLEYRQELSMKGLHTSNLTWNTEFLGWISVQLCHKAFVKKNPKVGYQFFDIFRVFLVYKLSISHIDWHLANAGT